MEPQNKQARDALVRCLKCIKEDTGVDYVPEGDDIQLPDFKKAEKPVEKEPIKVDDIKFELEPTIEEVKSATKSVQARVEEIKERELPKVEEKPKIDYKPIAD